VRWTEVPGEASFSFTVKMYPQIGDFDTVTSFTFMSCDDYNTVYVPGFDDGEVARVEFEAHGITRFTEGVSRFAIREPDPTGRVIRRTIRSSARRRVGTRVDFG
jgi:hypothetical protein